MKATENSGAAISSAGAAFSPKLEIVQRLPESDRGRPPVLFVHGLGHGAWCWQNWMEAVVDAGYPAYAVSLRGHGGSSGSLVRSMLGHYVDDVVKTAASLPSQPVIVGHSLGGLIVQRTIADYPARAAVLVAPVPSRPGVGTLALIARQHPSDAARIMAGGSLPLRYEYLFEGLDRAEADRYLALCGKESALAQYQVLLHMPAGPPRGRAPVLVLGTPDDRLIPLSDVRDTARRYSAPLLEFPGIGHDLMLDAGWEQPAAALVQWLDSELS
ncbi:MAG: lysophospholipase [Actinomycetota bacterium]|nr:lysophospholipase [Actinomycetota bacterium]